MNRKHIALLLLLLPIVSLADDKIVIDLKVSLVETADLAPAQTGASIYLLRSDWAAVSEVGEDVAVWLTGYERKKNLIGQQVISLSMEIREPTSFRTGNLLKKQKITVRYWLSSQESDKYNRQILNELDDISNELKMEAYHLGKKIESSLRSYFK